MSDFKFWRSYHFGKIDTGIELLNDMLEIIGNPDGGIMYTVLEDGTRDLLVLCDDELKATLDSVYFADDDGYSLMD